MPTLPADQPALFDLTDRALFRLPPALRKARLVTNPPKPPRTRRTFAQIRADHARETLRAPHLLHLDPAPWPKLAHDYLTYKTLGDMARTRRRAELDQRMHAGTGVPLVDFPHRRTPMPPPLDPPQTKRLPEPARPPKGRTQRPHTCTPALAATIDRLNLEIDRLA